MQQHFSLLLCPLLQSLESKRSLEDPATRAQALGIYIHILLSVILPTFVNKVCSTTQHVTFI